MNASSRGQSPKQLADTQELLDAVRVVESRRRAQIFAEVRLRIARNAHDTFARDVDTVSLPELQVLLSVFPRHVVIEENDVCISDELHRRFVRVVPSNELLHVEPTVTKFFSCCSDEVEVVVYDENFH